MAGCKEPGLSELPDPRTRFPSVLGGLCPSCLCRETENPKGLITGQPGTRVRQRLSGRVRETQVSLGGTESSGL